MEVVFHTSDGGHELFINFGHTTFEFVDVKRSTNASDDVFALGVGEEFGVDLLFAGSRVTGEGDAGAGIFTHVAEDHRLDVDGGAPFVGDAIHLTIDVGAGVVPAAEDSGDSFAELFIRIGREFFAEDGFVVFLVFGDEALELLGRNFGIELIAILFLEFVKHLVHRGSGVAFSDVGEHQDEAAIGVPGETVIAGKFGEFFNDDIVEAEVEDGVHHARH